MSAQSASLASQGPALLASRSEEALKERATKVKETQAVVMAKLGEITRLGADKDVVANLTETVKNIDDMINSLGSAARERLEAAAQHDKQYEALRKAQKEFVTASVPEMVDAQSQLHAVLTAVDPSADDASHAAHVVEQLGNVIASGNLLASNMAAALSATNSDTLEAIEKDFKETVERIKSNLEMLPKNAGGKTMSDAAAKLRALGEGKERIFKIRQKELDADDYGQTILEETRKLNVGLGISVQQLVDGVRKETDAASGQAVQEISWATVAMLALGVATLIGSVLFVWLYVGRSILRRMRALQSSMKVLSSGDLESEIYRSGQSDEIAEMSEFAARVPREHARGADPVGRTGQGPHRQGGARLPRGSAHRRIRIHRPRRARQPAELGQFDAGHGAKHVGDRRPSPARWSARWPPPPRKPRSTCRPCRPAPRNCPRRSPRSAARS